MKILLLGDVNSSHLLKWMRGLRQSNLEFAVFTLAIPRAEVVKEFAGTTIYSPHVNPDVKNSGDVRKLIYLRSLKSLKSALREFKPDIVHAHYATSYGLLAVLSRHPHIFVSVWGSDLLEFPQKSFLHRSVIRFILKRANEIFATSEILKRKVEEFSGRSSMIIPFGVDTEKFCASKKDANQDVIIGAVKSLETVYGMDVLIRAFHQLVIDRPSLNVKLRIVGEGTKEDELKMLVKELNLLDRVEFVGRVPFDELPKHLNRIDIFANLSRSESFGVSVLEAMSSELPVIVTKTGGLLEIVDESCGLFVGVEDFQASAKCMEKLALDAALRLKMGKEGRKRVLAKYDWNIALKMMIEKYHQTIN